MRIELPEIMFIVMVALLIWVAINAVYSFATCSINFGTCIETIGSVSVACVSSFGIYLLLRA